MSQSPFFSVIIPTYNRKHIISNAINSILKQTCENWELVIVDDCSTDNSRELILGFNDKRIKYYKLEQNLGNAGARNVGIKKSKGEYIVFLDSDDEMMPDCLGNFFNLIKNKPDTKFAFGDYQVYDTLTKITKKSTWKPDPSKSFLEELKIGTGCGIIVKKAVFEEVGYFDERLRVAVDTDWLIRLNKVVGFEYVPKIMMTIYAHGNDRVRNDKTELIKSYKIIVDKNRIEILNNKELIKKFYYKIQWLHYHQNLIQEGNKYGGRILRNKIIMVKSIVIFLIFNVLPYKTAIKTHLKMSGDKEIS